MLNRLFQFISRKTNDDTIPQDQIEINTSYKLGGGAYGKVYAGNLRVGGSSVRVAVKKVEFYDEEVFKREYNIIRQLKNCFVLKCFGHLQLSRSRFIVLEFCEGSLKQIFSEERSISLKQLDKSIILGQLTIGLSYIHGKRIIHKDIKPENILLYKKPFGADHLVIVKIADFGMGKQLRPGNYNFSKTNQSGTNGYIAPEFLVEEGDVYPTFRSDIYSLGIVFFYVLSGGQHPFGKPDLQLHYRMVEGSPNFDPICDRWEAVDLISKLIEKDPNKRPDVNLIVHHPFFSLHNKWASSCFLSNVYSFLKSTPRTDYKRSRLLYQLTREKVELWFNQMKTQSEWETIKNHFQTDNPPSDCLEVLLQNNCDFDYSNLSEAVNNSPKICTYLWSLLLSLHFSREEYEDYFQLTDLQFALLHHKMEENEIFYKDVSVDENIKLNSTPLYTAVCLSSFERVKFALTKNITNLRLRDKFGRSILYFAVRFANPEIVKELLRFRADPDDMDLTGETVLQAAVRYRSSIDIVNLLLEAGADVNKPGKFKQTALHVAAQNATLDIVLLLLERNANIHAVDVFGQNVLHSAVLNKSVDIVDKFLERGVPIQALDNERKSVLHLAAQYSTEEMVRFLVDKGADVMAEDNSGESVLHSASSNKCYCVVEFLLTKGLPIDKQNKKGQTSLHLAAERSTLEVVRVLLEHGADFKAVDLCERTALHFAAKNIYPEILKLLLSKRISLGSVDKFGKTALHVACEYSTPQVVRFLLDAGADPFVADKKKQTILHCAAKNYFPEIVDRLTQIDVDVNAKNVSGETAERCAAFRSSVDIIVLLQSKRG